MSVSNARISFEGLMREHDELNARRQRLLRLVEGAPAPAEALHLLIEFSVDIELHRASERRFVYGPLLRVAWTQPFMFEVDLELVVSDAERDWSAYLHGWDEEAMKADWPTFAAATQDVLGRAGERLRLENDVIYPLALQQGAITLRD